MNKKSLNSEINLLTGVIIFSFLLRIVSAYFFRDVFIENEWNILLNNLINYIIDKEYFEDDYVFDNIATGCLHMIILKLPKNVVSTFFDGRYSHLYTHTERKKFFRKKDEAYSVINKHYDYKFQFINQLKEEFGISFQ